jgi:hypothetical protein
VVRLNNEQLLEYLSDTDVLSYFLNAWNSEIEQNIAITTV